MRPHSKGSKSLAQWIKDKFPEHKINERDLWNFLEEKKIVEHNGIRRSPLNENICSSDGSSIVFKYLIVDYIQEFLDSPRASTGFTQLTIDF